jgi:ParB-like nuclease domain
MTTHVSIALEKLVFDEELYPRTGVDDQHVRQLERAMEAGITLPPIVVAKGSMIIADGVHRYHAHLRRGEKKIAAIVKTYKNKQELWHDAVLLNSGTGLKLGQDDHLRVIDISERLGFKELDIAGLLRTSIAHLRTIKPRFATVEEAVDGVAKLRKVPLKGSLRHLSGQQITTEQAEAMTSAPGQSYLLTANQLLDALRFNLLPPRSKHPALWEALTELSEMIRQRMKKSAA